MQTLLSFDCLVQSERHHSVCLHALQILESLDVVPEKSIMRVTFVPKGRVPMRSTGSVEQRIELLSGLT